MGLFVNTNVRSLNIALTELRSRELDRSFQRCRVASESTVLVMTLRVCQYRRDSAHKYAESAGGPEY